MKTGETLNERGTVVSKHICDTCGSHFTVCPKIEDGDPDMSNCLSDVCDSYNSARDVDKLFGEVVRVSTGKLN